jgi:release factor glutamine methyltransferase
MTKTITGKTVEQLETEMKTLYASYCSNVEAMIVEEHHNKVDAFSKLIMLYTKRINTYKATIEIKMTDFYRDFMSIKVLQLVYTTWKGEQRSGSTYSYNDFSNITVLPGVFSPEYASDSYLWAQYMVASGVVKNKRVLEMGAGTGIMSLYLSKYGNPSQVVAADINDQAIENIKLNQKHFDIQDESFSVVKSNLYSTIPATESFDVIFWAFVWLILDSKEMVDIVEAESDPQVKRLLNSVIDPGYHMLKRFLSESKSRLAENGKILLITTDFIKNDYVKSIAEELGYSFHIDRFTQESEVVKSADMVIDLYQVTLELK